MQVICGAVFSCFCFWDHRARYPKLTLKLWSLHLCLLGLITGIHYHICLLSRPQRRSYLKLWNRWTGSNLQVLHLTDFFWSFGESHNHCLLVVLAPVLQHSAIWLHSKLSLLAMVGRNLTLSYPQPQVGPCPIQVSSQKQWLIIFC